MDVIKYVEIENFKTFGEKLHIDIANPAVIIGPNNAGKTSIVQALALWSRGIVAWYEKKGNPKTKEKRERISAGINRLNIFELPVTDTRYLWKDTKVVHNNRHIRFSIAVGVEYENNLIYCRPDLNIINNDKLIQFLITINFGLLYPMSGIETEETLLPEGRINVLMGQGQTAQVLRNLCYIICESDTKNRSADWDEIRRLIKKMFLVDLQKPVFNEARGNLELTYKQEGVENDLDISLAGRGLQQFLLILAYLFSHKRSVLLIDEPDAHLEILRQRQVYEILRENARENDCQVIIATHSEVILEEAIDVNLTLLVNGTGFDMATSSDIRSALATFGIDHYVKAKVRPNILYIEGSTDVEILRALAKRLNHEAFEILSEPINVFYTQNINPERTLDSDLDIAAGAYASYVRHFHTLKRFVPSLKGLCIFDNDNRQKSDEIKADFAITYWRDYEVENYFISPGTILSLLKKKIGQEDQLFASSYIQSMIEIMDEIMLRDVFKGESSVLNGYKNASVKVQRTIIQNYKMSKFADDVFHEFSEKNGSPLLLRKSEYHCLVDFIQDDSIDKDVIDKLDNIVKYLTST